MKRVHFIGIGGVGMAGLAVLLKARGYEVSGCDLSASPRTRWLEAHGIRVFIGHDPSHLEGVDELIVTPAVDRQNAELRAWKGTIRFRGEVLAEVVSAADGIAVCGSHGKTTTSTWIAKLLCALGDDPSWCIGGETGDFPVAGVGTGPVVVEADESDGTLALYHAQTLVVNKCEYDHPDHFKTEADYFACYETAKQHARDVIDAETLVRLEELPTASGCEGVNVLTSLPVHNQKNARAAVEVALRRGHSLAAILNVLPEIVRELPDRRFQQIWPLRAAGDSIDSAHAAMADSHADKTVITDYAHHPTEMACAVQMARAQCAGVLRVLFQPHRYSRTKALLADFPDSFAGADEVILCPTYAAFEEPVEGGDVADLYAACRASSHAYRLYLSRSCAEAWEHARHSMRAGDLTLLLGAGDIIRLVPTVQADFLDSTSSHSTDQTGSPSATRMWIGHGSNTWKSDLALAVDYVRTTGPADRPGASLGIPWMAGIPGTIGGWIKMNAGAFGHSISDVIEAVKVDGKWIASSACGFSYRHSSLVGEIQDYKLKKPLDLGTESAETFLARRKKFPSGTYGSFFKNPPNDFAGRLLEEAGVKKLRVGGAFVWSEHANVIVRGEGWTASDVLALARLMRNRVLFRFGVALEPEVCGITL